MHSIHHDGRSVNMDGPAPLRAVVSLLSEGTRTCDRCGGTRIEGLAGYLFDADGRFIGVVHEKCVLPEELDTEPEPEGVATVPEQGTRGGALDLSEAVSEALAGAGIRVETHGEYVFFHIERRALPLAETFLPETGVRGRTEAGHESWGYRVAGEGGPDE